MVENLHYSIIFSILSTLLSFWISQVFNFSVDVKVEHRSQPLGKPEQDMTKLCNHRRKVVAMAALCRSMQGSQHPFANFHHPGNFKITETERQSTVSSYFLHKLYNLFKNNCWRIYFSSCKMFSAFDIFWGISAEFCAVKVSDDGSLHEFQIFSWESYSLCMFYLVTQIIRNVGDFCEMHT